MIFLESFTLPAEAEAQIVREQMNRNAGPAFGYIDNIYPCGIFPGKELKRLDFSRITILCGGNGSGKSTLLNLIAECLRLQRVAPFNSGETWELYTDACQFETGRDENGRKLRIPNGSRIITSDDVFDYMLAIRSKNTEITEAKEDLKQDWFRFCYDAKETFKMKGMEDYEKLRAQALACRKSVSRRQFLREKAGTEVRMGSNGETALEYFQTRLEEGTFYCLDEPENSLSPSMQLKLRQTIENLSRFGECQFVLATHSPFLLSLRGARIYDMDSAPAALRKWWELESVRTWFHFFDSNREFFQREFDENLSSGQ